MLGGIPVNEARRKLHEEGLFSLIRAGTRYVTGRNSQMFVDARDRKADIVAAYRDDPKYLNVGGGAFIRDHWRVLDHRTDWYGHDERFIDFDVDLEQRDEWPIETASYDLVYTSHTLEHLSDAAVDHTLEEAFRVLKPGGGIRINVPNIEIGFEKYHAEDIDWFVEIKGEQPPEELPDPEYPLEQYLVHMFASCLTNVKPGKTSPEHVVDFKTVRRDIATLDRRTFLRKYTEMIQDGWSEPGFHRNWFDPDRVVSLLEASGFRRVRRRPARQSRYTEFCHKSSYGGLGSFAPEDGFDNYESLSLFVEAEKA